MMVNLLCSDMIRMILGIEPPESVMKHPIIKPHGSNSGAFVKEWLWYSPSLKKLSEEELWDIYILCVCMNRDD